MIMAAIFFIAGYVIGKSDGYYAGYAGAYKHIRDEILEYVNPAVSKGSPAWAFRLWKS
jgi:hypothetical protein